MPGKVPNTSYDSFQPTKLYDIVEMQQGVPIPDNDWNEALQNIFMSQILTNIAAIGDMTLPCSLGSTANGYLIEEATVTTNNFQISAGWAMVGGVLVPTTMSCPPVTHDYEDNTNFVTSGAVTAVASPDITDAYKNWGSEHDLVGCRVLMTSGLESGNTFTITTLIGNDTVRLSGGAGTIAPGDTYIIKPPALSKPLVGSRSDQVYIAAWWDDIAYEEDSAIQNPGLGVETTHRLQRRWCVRVAEGGVTPTTLDYHSFGFRYFKITTISRVSTSSDILTADITNIISGHSLGALDGTSIQISPYAPFGITGADVQAYLYNLGTGLNTKSAPNSGATRIGSHQIPGSDNNITNNTIYGQLSALLGITDACIKKVHPTAATPNWVLLWRSSNVASDSLVTKSTISIYWKNGYFAILKGAYFISTNQITFGTGSGSASAYIMDPFGVMYATSTDPTPGTSINYVTPANWDAFDQKGISSAYNHHYGDTTHEDQQTFNGDTVFASSGTHQFSGNVEFANPITMTQPDAVIYGNGPDGTADGYQLLLADTTTSTGRKSRLYLSNNGLWITYNALYVNGSGWTRDVAGDSWAMHIGLLSALTTLNTTFNGFSIHTHFAASASPWTAGDWDSTMIWGDDHMSANYTLASPYISGDCCDVIMCSLFSKNYNTAGQPVEDKRWFNWHARMEDIVIGDLTIVEDVDTDATFKTSGTAVVTIARCSSTGFRLEGTSANVASLGTSLWSGYVYAEVAE